MKIRSFPTLFVSGLTVLALSSCGSNSSTGSSSSSASSTPSTSATNASSSTSAASGSSTPVTGSGATSPASSAADSTTTAAPKPSTVQVLAGPGIKFDLAVYTAKAGAVHVIYVNRDSQRHTLAIVDSEGKTLSGELEVAKSGATATHDYTLAAGTYKLICTVPGHQNMKATLTVS